MKNAILLFAAIFCIGHAIAGGEVEDKHAFMDALCKVEGMMKQASHDFLMSAEDLKAIDKLRFRVKCFLNCKCSMVQESEMLKNLEMRIYNKFEAPGMKRVIEISDAVEKLLCEGEKLLDSKQKTLGDVVQKETEKRVRYVFDTLHVMKWGVSYCEDASARKDVVCTRQNEELQMIGGVWQKLEKQFCRMSIMINGYL